jgi:GNAT superfamily N-acetyltransferase
MLHIRPADPDDLPAIIALDREVTGLEKPEYWREVYGRYGDGRRCFLVAASGGRVEGFVIGEVRAWEFGSPPCGWIFAIQVRPGCRLAGVGTKLFEAVRDRFRTAGVDRLRTMLARDNTVILSFFRSQGMMAGPFVELEMALDAP